MIPMSHAININTSVSLKNCLTRSERLAPTVFLIPTSLVRVEDWAVDKFMKFMQAINKMKNAIAENVYTKIILPPPFNL